MQVNASVYKHVFSGNMQLK